MVSEKLSRAAAVASLAVLGSRVLGLLREQLFAYYFGASAAYDAFLTAFRIPNLLRDLLAEGALSSAFTTVFVKEQTKQGIARAFVLANLVVNTFGLFLLLIVLWGVWQAPEIVHALASGFSGEKFDLTVFLARWMMPFILFAFLGAVLMAMLNAQGYYALPQSASSFFNIVSIGVGLGLSFYLVPEFFHTAGSWDSEASDAYRQLARTAMWAMAVGTLSGGMAQCLVQLPILYRLGFRYRWHWHWQDSGLKAVRCLLLPALLGSAAVQINVFINSNFASYLGDKAISWLNYAFRLIQFPIGLFGVSLVSAWLPTLNRAYTKADFPHFYRSFSEGMQLVCFFSLPAACGLAICSEPMVRLIYEHGRFTTMDTYATASAVMAYGLGLPGYAALKLLQPSFMTIGLAYQPMLVSVVAQILNFSVNLYWVGYGNGGHTALALTTSLLAIFSALWLTVLFLRDSRKRLKADDCVHRALMGQCMRMMVASLAMSIGCFYTYSWMQHHGFAHSSVSAFWELMVLVPMGFVLYLFVGIMVRVRIGLRLIGFQ